MSRALLPPVAIGMLNEAVNVFAEMLDRHGGACPPEAIVAELVERWTPEGSSPQMLLIVAEYCESLVAHWCGADRTETFRDVPPLASAELYRQAGARRLLDAAGRQSLVYDPLATGARALH